MTVKPRNLVLIVVAVGLATLFVRLGLWQLSRRAERAERNAAIETRAALPALNWTGAAAIPGDTTGLTWRRVRLEGRYDREHEIVLRGRAFEGQPGVEALTPLRTGGGAVLVIRGWIPAHDGLSPDLAAAWPRDRADTAVARLEGTIVPPATGRAGQPLSVESGGREHLVLAGADLEIIAERLPYPPLPYVVRLDEGNAAAAGLEALPLAAPGPGPHLAYAIQWFAFAAIALVGTGILLRKEGRS